MIRTINQIWYPFEQLRNVSVFTGVLYHLLRIIYVEWHINSVCVHVLPSTDKAMLTKTTNSTLMYKETCTSIMFISIQQTVLINNDYLDQLVSVCRPPFSTK